MSEIKSEHDQGKLVTITRAHYETLLSSHRELRYRAKTGPSLPPQQSYHEAMRNGPEKSAWERQYDENNDIPAGCEDFYRRPRG